MSSIKKVLLYLLQPNICKNGERNIKQEEDSRIHYKRQVHEIILEKIWLNNY